MRVQRPSAATSPPLAHNELSANTFAPVKAADGPAGNATLTVSQPALSRSDASVPRKRHGAAAASDGPVETLTYRDPFAGVYKKCARLPRGRRCLRAVRYIFTADGKYLLGGMMVGDTNDYVRLVALVKKKVRR